MSSNTLYYGDNLEVLKRYVNGETIDLVYLDPPFKSDQDYSVLFAEQDGSRSAAQIKAFEDTWQWDEAAASAYEEIAEGGGDIAKALIAFRQLLGESDMLAYLSMMARRLVQLKRVLKRGGALVGIEVALALVLLIGVGLLIRSMAALWSVNPGFRAENVMTFGLSLPPSMKSSNQEAIGAAAKDLHQGSTRMPGMRAVSNQRPEA
jgi:hypothetical protein